MSMRFTQCFLYSIKNAMTSVIPASGIYAAQEAKLCSITALWSDMTSPGKISAFRI